MDDVCRYVIDHVAEVNRSDWDSFCTAYFDGDFTEISYATLKDEDEAVEVIAELQEWRAEQARPEAAATADYAVTATQPQALQAPPAVAPGELDAITGIESPVAHVDGRPPESLQPSAAGILEPASVEAQPSAAH